MRTWNYSCCKYITDQLNTLWEIILNPWLPPTMYFIVIILLKIPQAYQDLVVPGRNSFSLPFPTITMKYIPPAVTMGGWRQCQSEEHLFALNPLSSAPSILRVTLKRWISTTVNNLPCIRKQSNAQKAPRFKARCRSAIIFCGKGAPGTKQWGGPAWVFVRCIWLEPG